MSVAVAAPSVFDTITTAFEESTGKALARYRELASRIASGGAPDMSPAQIVELLRKVNKAPADLQAFSNLLAKRLAARTLLDSQRHVAELYAKIDELKAARGRAIEKANADYEAALQPIQRELERIRVSPAQLYKAEEFLKETAAQADVG